MQIGDVLHQLQNAFSAGENTKAQQTGEAVASNTSSAVKNLLTPGNIFEGTVYKNDSGNVSIYLSNGESMNAVLSNGVSVNLGEALFFEVKGLDSQNRTQLKLYQGEVTNNPTISKALNSAGISVNPTTVSMVESMMENQMSVNKDALLEMVKNLSEFPSGKATTIVQMVNADIPLSKENITQFENYLSDRHNVTVRMESVINEAIDIISSDSVSSKEGTELLKNIMDILGEDENIDKGSFYEKVVNENEASKTDNVFQNFDTLIKSSDSGEGKTDGFTGFIFEDISDGEGRDPSANIDNSGQNTAKDHGENITENNKDGSLKPFDETIDKADNGEEKLYNADKSLDKSVLYQSYSNEDMTQLYETLKNISKYEPSVLNILDSEGNIWKDVDERELLETVKNALKNAKDIPESDIKRLFGSNVIRGVLKNLMEKGLLLEPDELKEKGSVKELYERMDNRMQRLSEAFLKSSAPDISSLSSKTEGIRENISFMNQLNQVYTYVQLPLKLMNQNANAELYVFSNKRKIDDDGTLSAFLHLDMDHLGSTDVYVKMKDKNVSNNFYFEDESAFDLIEDNIHILTQRLTEKGYNVNTTVENRSNKVDFVDDFLNQGRSAGTVHRYSFDVMA